jgi:hypothetical protein
MERNEGRKPEKKEPNFRVVPSEETEFGKSGVSYADYYGHGGIGDAVPYPGELPEEALVKSVWKGLRYSAKWGKDRLQAIWRKPATSESTPPRQPQK